MVSSRSARAGRICGQGIRQRLETLSGSLILVIAILQLRQLGSSDGETFLKKPRPKPCVIH